MPNTFQFRRGGLSGLPSLAAGEPGFTTDQFRLYVGSSGGNRLVGLLHNNAATAAPTVNDDAGDGYSVGSRWIDVTNDRAYECVDATVGSAVWQQQSGSGSGGITQLTGDVTAGPGSGSQAATIASDAVTNAKLANMATARLKGRVTSGTGDPEDLTGTQVTTLLDVFTSSLKGLVPASGGGTTNFLRADGTFAAPPAASVPTGTVIDYAGSSVPSGYLACDGSAVSRTTYSALFAALGTAWGAGDGSTTFNVPDLRGRATIGDGTGSGLSARSVGQAMGAETHGLSLGELPSHSHSLPTASATLGAGTTGYSSTGTTNTISGFSTTSGASGGGATHNNMQPSAVTKKCIKT